MRIQSDMGMIRRIAALACLAVVCVGGKWTCAQSSAQVDPNLLVPQPGQAAPLQKKAKKKKKKTQSDNRSLLLAGHTIPAAPLGFAPPAAHYLTHHLSQMSLDFLDEDHLLFTFRVPGLIPRPVVGSAAPPYERHIRAVVVQISTSQIQAEDLWTLHDTDRYLWMLGDGRFLLRDGNLLRIGDRTLRLHVFLRFQGPIDAIETDPMDRYLVADTEEASALPTVKRPSLLSATGSVSEPPSTDYLVRVLDLTTRKVVLFSHTEGVIHLPLSENGYYQIERAEGLDWLISYSDMTGHGAPYWKITSVCMPPLDPIAPGYLLATPCSDDGSRALVMLSRATKSVLWHVNIPATSVWPVLARAANGLRFARATLELSQPVTAGNPIDPEDIRGEKVAVYNTADGVMEFVVDTDPPQDAGGNFALSPSGRRVAVLRQGGIQVFDLPMPPVLAPVPAANADSAATH